LVPRLIDNTHPSFTELLGDLVMPDGFALAHFSEQVEPTNLLARLLSFRAHCLVFARPFASHSFELLRIIRTFGAMPQENSCRSRVPEWISLKTYLDFTNLAFITSCQQVRGLRRRSPRRS
jgi:hypothetical protein